MARFPRACHEATVFTDDVTRLAHHLGIEVSKSSALEITQDLSAARDQVIGIGI
jgi:hypothetical protein